MNMPQFTIDRWLGGKKAAAALTFDDWTPGQALVALPLLDKMQLKGTFFVTLSNFGIRPNEDHWWALQQLKSSGHEVGNHTINHSDLCTLAPTKLFAETTYAKEIFDDHLLGKPLTTFAYPFGKYNSTVINELQKEHLAARTYSDINENLNFNYQFVDNNEDYFKIASVRVNADLSENEFNELTDKYIDLNGFMPCVFHGIFNELCTNDQYMFDAIHEDKLKSLIHVLDNKRDDLWITTFGNAISYHRYVNSLDYRISVLKEQTLRIDLSENNGHEYPAQISAFVGFYNGKIPVSVTHNGKSLFVNYTENGIRILIDNQYINEPLYIHYQ
jgi:chitin deacetylase